MSGIAALARLLGVAEDASPLDAVAAVTRELGLRLGATSVTFLVLDTSGRALVRLTHVPLVDEADHAALTAETGHRTEGEESAQFVAFDGGPLEQVVRGQRTLVVGATGMDGRCSRR